MQLHTLTLSVLHELHCVACVGRLVGGHPVGTSYNSREKTDKECVRVHVCSDKDGSTGWSFTLAHCLHLRCYFNYFVHGYQSVLTLRYSVW